MRTTCVPIGFETGIKPYSSDIKITPTPGFLVKNGYNAVKFPEGTNLMGWDWQSSIKVAEHEVLFQLRIVGELFPLLSTHHVGGKKFRFFGTDIGYNPTMITKCDMLPYPIPIPPNGIVWVYSEGWGEARPAGVEVQTTLFLAGENKVSWIIVPT